MHDDKLNPPAGRDEGAMARADLYKLANYSKKLFHLIHDDQELEGWVQAKITKAADYIASVYHYLEYEMKVTEYGEKLENSDVYSESVKRAFQQKLFEARLKLKKINEKESKKIKEVVDQDDVEAARKRHAEKTGKDYEPKKGKKDDSKRVVKGKAYGGSKQKDDEAVNEVLDKDDIEAARKRHAEKKGKDYEPKKEKKDDARRFVKGKAYGGSKQKDDEEVNESDMMTQAKPVAAPVAKDKAKAPAKTDKKLPPLHLRHPKRPGEIISPDEGPTSK